MPARASALFLIMRSQASTSQAAFVFFSSALGTGFKSHCLTFCTIHYNKMLFKPYLSSQKSKNSSIIILIVSIETTHSQGTGIKTRHISVHLVRRCLFNIHGLFFSTFDSRLKDILRKKQKNKTKKEIMYCSFKIRRVQQKQSFY